MAIQHISEVIKELYFKKSREILDYVSHDGIESVIDSEELNFLLEQGILSHAVVYSAMNTFSVNYVRNN